MKITCLIVAAIVGIYATVQAAPVESVESARASVALQKVETFFSEKAVQDQLTALGISNQQVQNRLASLSDAQLEQVAAQVDMLKAGGTIQGGYPYPFGPVGCVVRQTFRTIQHVIQFLFCWTDIKTTHGRDLT
jgi:gas vesicle protein